MDVLARKQEAKPPTVLRRSVCPQLVNYLACPSVDASRPQRQLRQVPPQVPYPSCAGTGRAHTYHHHRETKGWQIPGTTKARNLQKIKERSSAGASMPRYSAGT